MSSNISQLGESLLSDSLVAGSRGGDRPAEQRGVETNAPLNRFFALSPEVLVIADLRGQFRRINPRCEEILGYSSAELAGRPIEDLVHPDDRAAGHSHYVAQPGAGGAVKFENRCRCFDGCYVTLRWNVIPSVEDGVIYAVAHDVTEQRRAEAELVRFAAIVSSCEDAIYTKDAESAITSWNRGAEKLYGYDAAEILGKRIDALIPKDREGEDAILLGRVLAGEHVAHCDSQRVRKDGTTVDISLTMSAVRDRAGTIVGASSIARDISARKLAEEVLEQARAAAVEASRLKSEFVANMSHEIRTPLNGVIGMTELLLDTDLEKDQRECADAIRTSGDALMMVISDILDFSKMEAGKLELDHSDFDPRQMVDDVLAIVATTANEKQLEVMARVDSEIPTMLRSDRSRIQQVLTNLVNNAVKFTPEGEVLISVTGVQSGAAPLLRFEVSDAGIGMEPAVVERVFDSFVQADSSMTREYGGSGLGLTICRRLVKLLGGEIGARSAPGKGSTFWFTVPFTHAARGQASRPALGIGGLRVLVVDDNKTNRTILDYQLRSWDMTCELAGGGDQALALLRAALEQGRPYALALLDYQMPGTDGLALAGKIKSSLHLRAPRLLMLTSSHAQLTACREAGIDGLVTKPVRASQLYDEIASVLGADRRRAPRGTATEIEDSARGNGERVLVVEDTPVSQKVALRLLERLGYSVEVASDGREAVEMSKRSEYAAIFMDCQMPRLDGYAATREIRRHESAGSRRVPIIAMTAHTMQGDSEKCLAAGMDDYIGKPLQRGALAEVVARNLRRGGQLQSSGPRPDGQETELQLLDPAQLTDISAGDERMVRELATLFKTDARLGIEELAAAVAGDDTVAVREIAHRLKGASATVGAARMADCCDRLSKAAAAGQPAQLSALNAELRSTFTSTVAAFSDQITKGAR